MGHYWDSTVNYRHRYIRSTKWCLMRLSIYFYRFFIATISSVRTSSMGWTNSDAHSFGYEMGIRNLFGLFIVPYGILIGILIWIGDYFSHSYRLGWLVIVIGCHRGLLQSLTIHNCGILIYCSTNTMTSSSVPAMWCPKGLAKLL